MSKQKPTKISRKDSETAQQQGEDSTAKGRTYSVGHACGGQHNDCLHLNHSAALSIHSHASHIELCDQQQHATGRLAKEQQRRQKVRPRPESTYQGHCDPRHLHRCISSDWHRCFDRALSRYGVVLVEVELLGLLLCLLGEQVTQQGALPEFCPLQASREMFKSVWVQCSNLKLPCRASTRP